MASLPPLAAVIAARALFAEELCGEVMEAAAPGEPLVGRAVGDVGHAVDAVGAEGVDARGEAGAFGGAPADVEEAHLAVEGGRVGKGAVEDGGDIVFRDAAEAAEGRDPRELIHVVVRQDGRGRLRAAAGEACHRTVLPVGEGAEGLVDEGDQLIDVDIGDGLAGDGADRRGRADVAAHHDDDHLDRLAGGDHVVEDEIHVALVDPAVLVLAHAMEEVEDGVALAALLIAGGDVDVDVAVGAVDLGVVVQGADLAVGDILVEAVVIAFGALGDFDAAGVGGVAEEGHAVRVGQPRPVHIHEVVVEAHDQRRRLDRPHAVDVLRPFELIIAHRHAHGMRQRQQELEIRLPAHRIHPRILRPQHIRLRRIRPRLILPHRPRHRILRRLAALRKDSRPGGNQQRHT